MTVNAALKSLPPAPTLDPERLARLARLTHGLAPADLYWIAAYSAAAAAGGAVAASLPGMGEQPADAGRRLTIVYGSQTGNSRRVAEQLATRAEAAGLPVRLLRAGAYPLRELVQERFLSVVISSQGDGDPPDDAVGFIEFIAGKRAPKLPQLKFAVLGLGDSSYPKYCAVSQALDARLAELGGQRFAELGEADVDFEAAAAGWSERALAAARATCPRRLRVRARHCTRCARWRHTRASNRSPPPCWRTSASSRATVGATCGMSNCRWKVRACVTKPVMRSACGRATRRRWSSSG